MRVFGNVCDEDITRFEAAPLPSEFETQFSMFVGDYFVLSGKDGSIYSYDLSGHNNVVAGNLEYLDPDSLRNATADYENKTVWICESGESNQLIRFSVTDGNIIHYELNDEYIQENNSEWIFRNDVLIIARGDFFHIIETQSWKEIARSESIFGYDSQKDRLISYDTDAVSGEVYIGWYPRYTVEDLLWKADKTVEKMRMSEEERVMYGLE